MPYKKHAVVYDQGKSNPSYLEVMRVFEKINDHHGFCNNGNELSKNIKYLELNSHLDTRDQTVFFSIKIYSDSQLSKISFVRQGSQSTLLGIPIALEDEFDTVTYMKDTDWEGAVKKFVDFNEVEIDTENDEYDTTVLRARFLSSISGKYNGQELTKFEIMEYRRIFGIDPYFEFNEVAVLSNKTTKPLRFELHKIGHVTERIERIENEADNLVFIDRNTHDTVICVPKTLGHRHSRHFWKPVFTGKIKSQRELAMVVDMLGINYSW